VTIHVYSGEISLQKIIKLVVKLVASVSSCIVDSTKEWIEGKSAGKLLVLPKEERQEISEAFVEEELGFAKGLY